MNVFRLIEIESLKKMKGIGKSIYERIEEIVNEGKLALLDEFRQDPKLTSLKSISRIWGVGISKVSHFFSGLKNKRNTSNNLIVYRPVIFTRPSFIQSKISKKEACTC